MTNEREKKNKREGYLPGQVESVSRSMDGSALEILPIGSVKWPLTIVFSTVNLLLGLDLKFLLLWLLLGILCDR